MPTAPLNIEQYSTFLISKYTPSFTINDEVSLDSILPLLPPASFISFIHVGKQSNS